MIQNLTIITITFNNNDELVRTYKNLSYFRGSGGTHVIVNGGECVRRLLDNDCILIQEKDHGIYDALNKGIRKVSTKYCMLIHSGDLLVSSIEILKGQLELMEINELDILLNDCTINYGKVKRKLNSRFWYPWMFQMGVQPPHPPIIYRYNSIKDYNYDKRIKVIADFNYLENIFAKGMKYQKGNRLLVEMSNGGKTSSGLKSFLTVSNEFIKLKGLFWGIWTAIMRLWLKTFLSFF